MRTYHDDYLILKTDGALHRNNLFKETFKTEIGFKFHGDKRYLVKTLDGRTLFANSRWTKEDAEFIRDYANSFAPEQVEMALEVEAAA